jgi:hypothetical protein
LFTESGQLFTKSGQLFTESGQLFTESGQLFTESGQLFTESGQLFTESGQLFTDSGQLFTESGQLSKYLAATCVGHLLPLPIRLCVPPCPTSQGALLAHQGVPVDGYVWRGMWRSELIATVEIVVQGTGALGAVAGLLREGACGSGTGRHAADGRNSHR